MGLRDPKDKIAELAGEFSLDRTLQDLDEQAKSAEQGKWESYKIEIITPIFGGGVKAGEPDTQMPIRASAIQGQLRYWWRFLAKNRRIDPLSGEDLFKAERDIWGGMTEEGEDYNSKVKLRIHIDPDVPIEIKPCATRHSRRVKNKWTEEYEEKIHVNYDKAVPEYAMFPGRGELPDEATGKKDKPPCHPSLFICIKMPYEGMVVKSMHTLLYFPINFISNQNIDPF